MTNIRVGRSGSSRFCSLAPRRRMTSEPPGAHPDRVDGARARRPSGDQVPDRLQQHVFALDPPLIGSQPGQVALALPDQRPDERGRVAARADLAVEGRTSSASPSPVGRRRRRAAARRSPGREVGVRARGRLAGGRRSTGRGPGRAISTWIRSSASTGRCPARRAARPRPAAPPGKGTAAAAHSSHWPDWRRTCS